MENPNKTSDSADRFYKLGEAIETLKQTTKKRKFAQTFDVIFGLKNIDLRKPENKFSKDVPLPFARGKSVEIGIISDTKQDAIKKSDIDAMSDKEIKQLARRYEFLLCEAPLMPYVGKKLGKFLGPIGKMPSPIPPGMQNTEPLVNAKKKSVRIRLRDSLTIQVPIGTETMPSDQLEENAKATIAAVEKSLPKGRNQIKLMYIKLTMSKPLKLEM